MTKKNKIVLELTKEEADIILIGLKEVLSTEEHGSERIEIVDHISNLIYNRNTILPIGDSNGC